MKKNSKHTLTNNIYIIYIWNLFKIEIPVKSHSVLCAKQRDVYMIEEEFGLQQLCLGLYAKIRLGLHISGSKKDLK